MHPATRHGGRSEPYGLTYAQGDVITCVVDLDEGTLEFQRNGQSLGVAHDNVKGPVRPAVAMGGGCAVKIVALRQLGKD